MSQRGHRRGEESRDMEGRKKELQRIRDQGRISNASNRGGVVFAVKCKNTEGPSGGAACWKNSHITTLLKLLCSKLDHILYF